MAHSGGNRSVVAPVVAVVMAVLLLGAGAASAPRSSRSTTRRGQSPAGTARSVGLRQGGSGTILGAQFFRHTTSRSSRGSLGRTFSALARRSMITSRLRLGNCAVLPRSLARCFRISTCPTNTSLRGCIFTSSPILMQWTVKATSIRAC